MASFKQIVCSVALIAPVFGGCDALPVGDGDPSGEPGLTEAAMTGTATRPLLIATQAAHFTVLKYLAKSGSVTSPAVGNWNPITSFTTNYHVAPSGDTHTNGFQAKSLTISNDFIESGVSSGVAV